MSIAYLILTFIAVSALFFSFQKLTQKVFPKLSFYIPFSILFGTILLFIPFSDELMKYFEQLTNFMLAVIFCLIPLSMNNLGKRDFRPIKRIWMYTMMQHLIQWGLVGLIVLFILGPVFSIPDAFVSIAPGGFTGGHGSAAVMGEFFDKLSHPELRSLLMATATIGMGMSIGGGVFWLARFKGKGELELDLDEHNLPNIPLSDYWRPLLYMSVAIGGGYFLSHLAGLTLKAEIPLFTGALVAGFIYSRFKILLPTHIESAFISDKSTDLLVVFGIASIKIGVLGGVLGFMSVIWLIGLLNALIMLHIICPRLFGKSWQEIGLFGWGWGLGGLMMGFALLKSINPSKYPTNIQNYSIAYMMVSPIEVLFYLMMPWLLVQGHGVVACSLFAACAVMLFVKLWRTKET